MEISINGKKWTFFWLSMHWFDAISLVWFCCWAQFGCFHRFPFIEKSKKRSNFILSKEQHQQYINKILFPSIHNIKNPRIRHKIHFHSLEGFQSVEKLNLKKIQQFKQNFDFEMIEALSDSLSCLRSQFMSTLSTTSSSSSTNSTSSLDEISKGFRNFFFHFHRFGQKGEYEPTFRKMKDSVNRTLLLGSCIDVGFNIWMCGENERGENVALTDLWTKRMAENLKGMEKKQEFIHHLFFIHHFIDYESRRFEDFKKIKFYNGISHNYRILGNLISAHLGNIIEFASSFNSHSFSLLEKKNSNTTQIQQ